MLVSITFLELTEGLGNDTSFVCQYAFVNTVQQHSIRFRDNHGHVDLGIFDVRSGINRNVIHEQEHWENILTSRQED